MILRFIAALTAMFVLGASAAAQEYSIRANRGLNLRAAPSLDADIADTVRSGALLLVVGQVDNWLTINWQENEVWLANWVNFSRVDNNSQTSSHAEATSPIDNCCFVNRQCQSDQEWTDGYWAFQNGQCPLPSASQSEASSRPANDASGQIDNCCFTGWQCNSDQEWANGYHAYQNNQCAGSPAVQPASADSCCALGWNCAFDFDFIMGKWWFEGNGGQCGQPMQRSVDGVIVEGSRSFIAQHKAAMQLLKNRAPEWHAYTTNIIRKIRESRPKPGYGTLNQSFNVQVWPSVAYAAAIIVHETCHVQRSYAGVHTHDLENIAEEAICDQVAIEALKKFSPGTYYPRRRIDIFHRLGHNWDIGPSVQRELDRAANLLAP